MTSATSAVLIPQTQDSTFIQSHNSNKSNQTEFSHQHHGQHSSSSASHQHTLTCHVTFADGRVFHMEMHRKMTGQECLNKICSSLGIIHEREYFGLQYFGAHGEVLWVSLRNRLCTQMVSPPPYSFHFRVKYYVPPDILRLDETIHQFYLNATLQLVLGMWTYHIEPQLHAQLIALMTQVKFGNFVAATTPCKYACFWPDCCEEIPSTVVRLAAEYQREHLENSDTLELERELLRLAAVKLPFYGVFFYEVKNFAKNRHMIGVGPKGVEVMQKDLPNHLQQAAQHIEFTSIHHLEERHRSMIIHLRPRSSLSEDEQVLSSSPSSESTISNGTNSVPQVFQLSSRAGALSLYRCVSEMRTFYCCEALDPQMVKQTLNTSTLFNNHEFMFDLRYTLRELGPVIAQRLSPPSDETPVHTSTEPQSEKVTAMRIRRTHGLSGIWPSSSHRSTSLSSSEFWAGRSPSPGGTAGRQFISASPPAVSVAIPSPRLRDWSTSLDETAISVTTGRTIFFHPLMDSSAKAATDHGKESRVVSLGTSMSCSSAMHTAGSFGIGARHKQRPSSSKEMVQIHTQLERLRDAVLCRICMDEVTSQVFEPCGHAVCCQTCAHVLTECPICRRLITAKTRFHAPWTMDCLASHSSSPDTSIPECHSVGNSSSTSSLPVVLPVSTGQHLPTVISDTDLLEGSGST